MLYTRALLAEKLDQLDILEADLRSILSREPENADALNALGYTLADRTDRYAEAYELIKLANKLKPNDAAITDSLGWVLYRMGEHKEAEKHLRRALELQWDPEIAAHLTEVLYSNGDREGARALLKRALETSPDHEALLNIIRQIH